MSFLEQLKLELKAIFKNPSILLTIFGGVVFYSFLYPQPYLHQVVREQKIAVINLDNSQLSRKLTRMVDATAQVQVVRSLYSKDAAKEALIKGDIAGFLIIPHDFYKDILLQKSPTLAYAGDGSYFLVYGTIAEGIATAVGTLNAQINSLKLVKDGLPLSIAKKHYAEVKLNAKPVFNPTIGYINYVVSGIFILIIHQTLLIGVGLLGGTQTELTRALFLKFDAHHPRHGHFKKDSTDLTPEIPADYYWLLLPSWRVVLGRIVAFSFIYIPLLIYYFEFCFPFYAIPQLASRLELAWFSMPFLMATTALGIVIGGCIPRRELATFIVLVSSLPLAFGAGFIWPLDFIPEWINSIMQLFPAIPAMMGSIQLNQMGADFAQVAGKWWQLVFLTIFYYLIAYGLIYKNKRWIVSLLKK